MPLLVCQIIACCCALLLGARPASAAPSLDGVPDGSVSALPSVVVPSSIVPSSIIPSSIVPSHGGDEPAPMCDPDGASVAAGEEIPEIDRGRFEALPCEAQLLMTGWRLDDPEFGCKAHRFDERQPLPSQQGVPRPRCDGAHEFSVPFPERAEPTLVSFDESDGLAPSRGHARSLFRPPVARA